MTKQKLTIKEKMSYGFGGFVDQIMSGTFGMKDGVRGWGQAEK
jgi:Na+/melibiose symporter-like transporter